MSFPFPSLKKFEVLDWCWFFVFSFFVEIVVRGIQFFGHQF